VNTYTDDDVSLSLSETIDREIIHAMDTVCNKLRARGRMQELLDNPLSDMPLYVNEGGAFEVVAVWRLSIGK